MSKMNDAYMRIVENFNDIKSLNEVLSNELEYYELQGTSELFYDACKDLKKKYAVRPLCKYGLTDAFLKIYAPSDKPGYCQIFFQREAEPLLLQVLPELEEDYGLKLGEHITFRSDSISFTCKTEKIDGRV